MTSPAWFRDVPSDLPVAGRAVLDGLVEVLDVAQPQALDRARSEIRTSGHGWAGYDVELRLAHADGPRGDVVVAIGSDEALLTWSTAHEHVHTDDGDAARPWTTVVVDATAALLRGEYEVWDHYRGSRLVRTSVHDTLLGSPHVSTGGPLLGLLPSRGRVDRVQRRAVDFRCRG